MNKVTIVVILSISYFYGPIRAMDGSIVETMIQDTSQWLRPGTDEDDDWSVAALVVKCLKDKTDHAEFENYLLEAKPLQRNLDLPEAFRHPDTLINAIETPTSEERPYTNYVLKKLLAYKQDTKGLQDLEFNTTLTACMSQNGDFAALTAFLEQTKADADATKRTCINMSIGKWLEELFCQAEADKDEDKRERAMTALLQIDRYRTHPFKTLQEQKFNDVITQCIDQNGDFAALEAFLEQTKADADTLNRTGTTLSIGKWLEDLLDQAEANFDKVSEEIVRKALLRIERYRTHPFMNERQSRAESDWIKPGSDTDEKVIELILHRTQSGRRDKEFDAYLAQASRDLDVYNMPYKDSTLGAYLEKTQHSYQEVICMRLDKLVYARLIELLKMALADKAQFNLFREYYEAGNFDIDKIVPFEPELIKNALNSGTTVQAKLIRALVHEKRSIKCNSPGFELYWLSYYLVKNSDLTGYDDVALFYREFPLDIDMRYSKYYPETLGDFLDEYAAKNDQQARALLKLFQERRTNKNNNIESN